MSICNILAVQLTHVLLFYFILCLFYVFCHADCGKQISKQEYKVGKQQIVSTFPFPSQNKEGTKTLGSLIWGH